MRNRISSPSSSTFADSTTTMVDSSGLRVVKGAEADEIVTTGEQRCGARHRLDVEVFLDPPDVFLHEGHLPCRDLVEVGPAFRIVPGVKAALDGLGGAHHDRGGQPVVERADQFASVAAWLVGHPEMGDLSESMDAGIGASGTLQFDLAAEEVLGSLAQGSLNAAGILLVLPSAVAGAIVLEGQLPDGHMPSLPREGLLL